MGDLVPITSKLEKLIPRLGSDADGEIVATVRAIGRALKSSGCDWHDLAAALTRRAEPTYFALRPDFNRVRPASDLHRMALWLMQHAFDRIKPSSRPFFATMVTQLARRGASAKQERYLRDLYAQHGGPAA